MSDSEIKESRTIMRRVEEHLRKAHLDLGAHVNTVGFVDVIHHETSILPSLNYVTPRRNTAWVSGKQIQSGLDVLSDLKRPWRVRFADGLYPPIFIKALRDLGLDVESDIPIMVYKRASEMPKLPSLPTGVSFSRVADHQGMAIWWYVWRNAYYDVITSGAEPLLIGSDMRDMYMGIQLNVIMYRHRYPMGVARVTIHEGSAHLVSQAILKNLRTPEWEGLLRSAALEYALKEGCDLVFATGTNVAERQLYRDMGFIDSGSIVSYAEAPDGVKEVNDDSMEQSILVV